MLSAVDGVLGAPLAGFRAGATAVVGARARRRPTSSCHGENGFVADADDVRGAARFLDLLARDRELLDAAAERRPRDRRGVADVGRRPRPSCAPRSSGSSPRTRRRRPPGPSASWATRSAAPPSSRQEHATLTAEVHRLQAAAPPVAAPLRGAQAAAEGAPEAA